MCPAGHTVRPTESSIKNQYAQVTNDEKQKENCDADQFFSSLLERELRAAGFCSVHERSLTVPRIWAGTPHELWTYQQEVSTLYHPLFNSIPTDLRAKVDAEVSSLLARFQSGSVLSVPVNVIVAGGNDLSETMIHQMPRRENRAQQ